MKLAVLISGGGTTLVNLQDHIKRGTLPCEIAVVIASNECVGAERAKASGLNTAVVRRGSFQNVEAFSDTIFEEIRDAGADAVVLAGFLSLIRIPEDYTNKVINIHPSLIPAFCGKGYFGHKVHEAAIDRGVKVSGCTVHFADNAYDHGPIILQRTVSVPDGATPEDLAKLVFQEEKLAYPAAIRLFAEGRLKIENRRVMVLPDPSDEE